MIAQTHHKGGPTYELHVGDEVLVRTVCYKHRLPTKWSELWSKRARIIEHKKNNRYIIIDSNGIKHCYSRYID